MSLITRIATVATGSIALSQLALGARLETSAISILPLLILLATMPEIMLWRLNFIMGLQ